MDNFDLKKYLKEDKLNEVGTPEQQKIQKVVSQYINLRKAMDNPNYPDTAHTYAAMKKVENVLQQMSRKESYRVSLLKMLPNEYQDFLKENKLNENEPVKYIGKKVNHPIATEAAKEAALNSTFAPNQHYIFEKGFLEGIKWLEDKK